MECEELVTTAWQFGGLDFIKTGFLCRRIEGVE